MIVTTTGNIEGKRIVSYLTIVSGEAIMGANAVRDFMASVTDVIGGRSGAYEGKLKRARDLAIKEMIEQAKDLGANAIVGVDLDYETVSDSMLMATASGTAVIVE